jgi:DNA polymerase elongation subunit (family B)
MFLRNKAIKQNTDDDLTFQIISWYTCDYETDSTSEEDEENETKKFFVDKKEYLVKVFGVTKEGYSVSANLLNFTPYFYIKVPFAINTFTCERFKEHLINNLSGPLKESVISAKLMKKQDFYGFHNGTKYNFIRFAFKSLRGFKQGIKVFQKKIQIQGFMQQKYKLYESNIEPFLRLMHICDIEPTGWVKIPGKTYELNSSILNTSCQIDINCKWNVIQRFKNESMAPIIVCSFDLECMSSHGDFPVPKKNYSKVANEIIQEFSSEEVSSEKLIKELIKIYEKDTIGILSKVYTKNTVNLENIELILNRNIDELTSIISGKLIYNPDTEKLVSPTGKITRDDTTQALIKKLNNMRLPELEGDNIIQIGTTVHYYGDKTCNYRNIITLGSCDDIEDTDVIRCETEEDMILKWRDLIKKIDPDIITGYNIFGFDFEYLYERSKELNIQDQFIGKLSRITDEIDIPIGNPEELKDYPFVRKKLYSSALGENMLKFIDMQGRVLIDLMKVIQRDHKLDSYKLDSVANHFMKMNKDDVSPNDIFRLFKGNSADRCKIAKYCVQDCALCNHLIMKLETLANNIGMSNVCNVPLSYIFLRGQGIKIFSLVAKQCREDDFIIPTLNKFNIEDEAAEPEDEEGYEGAIVLPPQCGIYIDDPVSVLDYASLYPSSMISENLSQDTYVMDSKYDNLPDVEYLDISYDIFEGIGDKKKKVGIKTCRFVQTKEKGILPRILMKLLKQRKETRKKIEYKTITLDNGIEFSGLLNNKEGIITLKEANGTLIGEYPSNIVTNIQDTYNEFQQAVLDGLQIAYKVTANSLYGQCGAKTSSIYMKEVAASTTATGRAMILKAKKFIEDNYDAQIVYGDSVTGDTPLIIKFSDNTIDIITIDNLTNTWIDYKNFKIEEQDLYNKEQSFIDAEIWANGKWVKIHRVIRHKCNKNIYRVNTYKGCVDVTEDHSLIDIHGNQIKPTEINNTTEIMHSFPDEFSEEENLLNKEKAWVYGLFFAFGNCTLDKWSISNISNNYLNLAKFYLGHKFIYNSSSIYTLDTEIIREYRELFYDKDNNKKVPKIVLNSNNAVRKCFLDIILINQSELIQDGVCYSICDSKISAQGLYYIAKSIGWHNLSIEYVFGKYCLYYLVNKNLDDKVMSITKIPYNQDEYVYDIETSCGKFHGGVGEIVLKNTDSLFVKFNNKDENGNLLKGKDALSSSIHTACDVSKEFRKTIKSPHDLEYEKTFWPFILLSKKRYIANKYEFDIDHFKQASMGVVLRRRDNANIVKTIYGGIIDRILNEKDIKLSIEFLNKSLQDLIDGKFPLDELIISKSLKSIYKDPTRIAHKVLADRMKQRDPGSAPQVNDRLPYVYIQASLENKGKKLLQGEKIEHPDYIRHNNLKPDYEFYITNQIMKPILQVYALILEDLKGFHKGKTYFSQMYPRLLREKEGNETKAKDRLQDLREEDVKAILFDPFLNKIINKRNGYREITDFFSYQK